MRVIDLKTRRPLDAKEYEDKDCPCSFCDCGDEHISTLFVRGQVAICSECIGICNGVLSSEGLPRTGTVTKSDRGKPPRRIT